MSWWVMEQVSVNEAGTQTLANIQCDYVSDLPAPDQSTTLGYIIVRGSQAKVLATSENYILGSTGTWVKMEDGVKLDLAGYATEQYVDDGLADKVDTSVYSSGQAAQDDEISILAAQGAKNLFPNTAISQTIGGVTFTVNGDGTVTVNGTKTNNDWFILSENNSFDAGTYTLSDGLPDDTANCRLIISTTLSMSAAIMSTETGLRTQTKTFTTAQTGLYYAIRIANGATVNNLTFKPMIRRAEITDSTYVPYAPTNRELYEMILALQ